MKPSQARRLREAMTREIFYSSEQMRNNIYQIRQILQLPYVFFGGSSPQDLLKEWKHLTRLVKDWEFHVQ